MTLVAAAEATGVDIGILLDQSDMTADVEDGLRTDSTTLWLLAGFAAVAAVVVLGQALTRQVWGGAEDFGTLRALGHTTRDLAAVGAGGGGRAAASWAARQRWWRRSRCRRWRRSAGPARSRPTQVSASMGLFSPSA